MALTVAKTSRWSSSSTGSRAAPPFAHAPSASSCNVNCRGFDPPPTSWASWASIPDGHHGRETPAAGVRCKEGRCTQGGRANGDRLDRCPPYSTAVTLWPAQSSWVRGIPQGTTTARPIVHDVSFQLAQDTVTGFVWS